MKKLLFTLIALMFAATPGLAAPKLTIYTYESFVSEWGPGPKIEAAFEATCGCEIEWVGIADGVAVLNRLKLEGKGTKADIVLGLDTNLTAEAAATGLFAPHEQIGTPLTLPTSWSDPIFLPYDYGYFAVVYDTQTLKDPPKSLADLVERRSQTEDRHRGSAFLNAGPRPAALDESRIWRQGRGGLDQAPAAHSHGDARLVGGLRAFHQRRGADGTLLYDLARLSHGGGE